MPVSYVHRKGLQDMVSEMKVARPLCISLTGFPPTLICIPVHVHTHTHTPTPRQSVVGRGVARLGRQETEALPGFGGWARVGVNQTWRRLQVDGKIILQVLATLDSLDGTKLTDQGNIRKQKIC